MRAETALQIESILRKLARQRQVYAGYIGGLTRRHLDSPRIDTLKDIGRLAGVSKQTLQYVRIILQRADCIEIEKLRLGKIGIFTVYKQVMAAQHTQAA